MSNNHTGKVITANDLLNGDVVYINSQLKWALRLSDAKVFIDDASFEKALSHANKQQNEVVGIYSININLSDTGIAPNHFREKFRNNGPSNYNHGKQSEVL
tara:strand:- start:52 stop:354 length:303 start_codon:yes stop_codon:yes gene_type:complete